MRRPKVNITPTDLCAVDLLSRRGTFTFREFAHERSPRLSSDAARNVLRRMLREGDVVAVGRGSYAPTPQGRQKIVAVCARPAR